MSLSSHLTQLEKKHASISTRIETEQRSPGSDDLHITELKREKLRLKEEIVKLAEAAH